MISTFQFRAARFGIGITLKELGNVTKVGYVTLCKIEEGPVSRYPRLRRSTLEKIVNFYKQCGVSFIDNNSVVIEFKSQQEEN